MSTTFRKNLFWRVPNTQIALKKGVNRTFSWLRHPAL